MNADNTQLTVITGANSGGKSTFLRSVGVAYLMMQSPQSLSEAERRLVALWAADCSERVLALFETEVPKDGRPRDAIARTRAFAHGELDAVGEIRRRFVAGRAAHAVSTPAAVAVAQAAAQAASVAHMGAHTLGAAAYAAKGARLVGLDQPTTISDEVSWQLEHMSTHVRAAIRSCRHLVRTLARSVPDFSHRVYSGRSFGRSRRLREIPR